MGFLTDRRGVRFGLHPSHSLGRSRRMHTQLENPEASAQHAVLTWSGTHWSVRDLGSRNGTFHNGTPIDAGVDVTLAAGDRLAFGTAEMVWSVTEVSPPTPFAVSEGQLIEGEGDILALPSLEEPQALVQFESNVGWVCVTDDGRAVVVDGESVVIDGRSWVLGLPEETVATVVVGAALSLDEIGLDFRVSSDEEYVEITVRRPLGTVPLPPRAHHELLLVLARARLEDAAQDGSEATHGWVYSTDLQKMMRLDRHRINLGLHRARQEFLALGITDAKALVERRTTSHQIRLGVADLSIGSL